MRAPSSFAAVQFSMIMMLLSLAVFLRAGEATDLWSVIPRAVGPDCVALKCPIDICHWFARGLFASISNMGSRWRAAPASEGLERPFGITSGGSDCLVFLINASWQFACACPPAPPPCPAWLDQIFLCRRRGGGHFFLHLRGEKSDHRTPAWMTIIPGGRA